MIPMRFPRSVEIWTLLAAFAGAALYVAAMTWLPRSIISNATIDDALYMAMGQSISKGEWLGEYYWLTLTKLPGYSLFLAANAWSGLSIATSQALLHCLAVAALSYTVFKLTRWRVVSVVFFLLLLWHPAPALLPRIIRGAIYQDQFFLLLSCAFLAFFLVQSLPRRLLLALAGGLFWGWLWCTREESVWSAPVVLLLVLCAFFAAWRRKKGFVSSVAIVCALAVGFSYVLVSISAMNYKHYGVFALSDKNDPNFQGMLSTLQRVERKERLPYLPIPESVREKAYAVSPSFRQLQEILEYPGNPFQQAGCDYYPHTCDDTVGAWLEWHIRYAAAANLHHLSAQRAQQYYARVHSELQSACKSGELDCRQGWKSKLPFMLLEQLDQAPQALWKIVELNILSDPEGLLLFPSQGTDKEFYEDVLFLNSPRFTPRPNEDPNSAVARSNPQQHQFFDPLNRYVYKAYQLLSPVLAVAGLLAFLAALAMSRKRPEPRLAVLLAALLFVGVAGRSAILVVVELTMFPMGHYASFTSGMFFAGCCLSVLAMWQAFRPSGSVRS